MVVRTGSHRRKQKSRVIPATCAIFMVVALVALGVGFATLKALASTSKDIPRLDQQQAGTRAETSQIYAADGSILAYLYGTENRTAISSQDLPNSLKRATVAIEDRRFYVHKGVDYEGMLRAVAQNVKSEKVVQGGSTITQQLVGNLYLDRTDTSIKRKIQEAALAIQYEKNHTKDQILTEYLNTVYYGENAYGAQAAAQTYFGKDPKDLTLAESAMLAGLPQSPSADNPRQNMKAAIQRRADVLAAMQSQWLITTAQYQQAVKEPVKLTSKSPYTQVREPYVVDYVKSQLLSMFGKDRVFEGGLRVETTINPEYQKQALNSIRSILDQPGDPSAALVSVEPGTGYIRAMVCSTDYQKSQFNLAAQSRRQPGSAFKTFALVASIEMGMNPFTTVFDSRPVTLHIKGDAVPWTVHTFSNKYYGPSTIAQATLRSDNSVFAQLAVQIGAGRIVNVAHRMGITSNINATPAIVLGGLTQGVSALEMASAYGTLANQGQHVEPTIITKVTDSTGKVIWQAQPKKTQAIAAAVAYWTTQILSDNIKRGTGTKAEIGRPAAGKTGTATDFCDAWFAGYTPNLSTSVWIGYPKAKVPMKGVHGINVTGGTLPAEIWAKFMYWADRDYPLHPFAVPFAQAYGTSPSSTYAQQSTTASAGTSIRRTTTSGTVKSRTTTTHVSTTKRTTTTHASTTTKRSTTTTHTTTTQRTTTT